MKFIIILLLTTMTCSKADVRILDYTNAQLISIRTGNVRIQTGNFRIIHIINLQTYEETLMTIEDEIKQRLTTKSPTIPFLIHELRKLQGTIARMKPRPRRSLNFLGTTWKWIAGTPDHDDHKIVTDEIEELLVNNNQQKIINKESIIKINQLTNVTNTILKLVRSNEISKLEIEQSIYFRLNIIKDEIVNIEYALQWAKAGIANSFILSEEDLSEIKMSINFENFPYGNIEQALEFAQIKIARKNSTIIYILSLPIINELLCEKLLIKPIKKHNTITKISNENIIQCKNKKLYEIVKNCKEFNELCICNQNEINDISNNNCIPKLLASNDHECPIINSEHIPTIDEISSGNILLNQFNGTIKTLNGQSWEINGSFLVQFNNETLIINGKNYTTKEISTLVPLPAVLQLLSNSSRTEEILSLQRIKELHLQNTKSLSKISFKEKIFSFTNIAISICIIAIIVPLYITKLRKNPTQVSVTNIKLDSETKQDEKVEQVEIPQSNKSLEFRSKNELPVY